jgi:DNA polymerase mu
MRGYYDLSSDSDNREDVISAALSVKRGSHHPPPEISIKVGLVFREEFNQKIASSEVEEMHATVMNELSHIQKGCISTIVGG